MVNAISYRLRQTILQLRRWRTLLPIWAKPSLTFDSWSCTGEYIVGCFTFEQYRQIEPEFSPSEYRALLNTFGVAW